MFKLYILDYHKNSEYLFGIYLNDKDAERAALDLEEQGHITYIQGFGSGFSALTVI